MAVFDIDNTILDSTQRFQDAYRAKIVDKEGKALKKKTFETMGTAMKRRNEFLYKPTNLSKDKVIPGSQALINDLIAKGYIIAYVTSRPFEFHQDTHSQLEEKGFPIFRSNTGEILLNSKPKGGQTTAAYKVEKLVALSQQYDVRMFFDDKTEILSAVASEPSLDIPGIYSSIKEYRQYQSRSNPSLAQTLRELEEEEEERRMGGRQRDYGRYGQSYSWQNPPVKPRRKKMSNGNYRKEPAKKYIDRFMGDSKMVSEFPDAGQRYAVGLTYVEKYYGKSGLDSVGARQNPGHDADEPYTINMRTFDKWGFEHTDQFGKSATAKTLEQAIEIAEEMDDDYLSYPMDLPKAQGGDGSNLITITDSSGDVVWENPRNNPEEYSENYMVPRDIHRLGKAADRLEGTYEDGQEVPEWWKSKLSVTAKDADTIADSLEYVDERGNPRNNPANPSKVEKGKKLYKHMNGKNPEKVEKKTIDMGDVWYQVGEGGCWQIGYMSGKETGSSEQKYTHHFNEETKDGNYPKLYATMPENGKPMLIITGGTWKIKTDDQGVAWIYD